MTDETPTRTAAAEQVGVWLVRVAVGAGVVWTAMAEYTLARMIGTYWIVAVSLPVALDVYVIAAIRRGWRRDLFGALAIMGAAQICAHLLEAHQIGVSVPLVTVVAMLVPISIWRAHALAKGAGSPPFPTPVVATPVAVPTPEPAVSSATEPPAPDGELSPETVAAKPTEEAPSDDGNERQEAPSVAAPDAEPVADKTPKPSAPRRRKAVRSGAPKRAPRRSLDEWVDLAGPVFHDEFRRLRRQPTANEFATAIAAAGLGSVSDTTAKTIRTELLDRAELPALD